MNYIITTNTQRGNEMMKAINRMKKMYMEELNKKAQLINDIEKLKNQLFQFKMNNDEKAVANCGALLTLQEQKLKLTIEAIELFDDEVKQFVTSAKIEVINYDDDKEDNAHYGRECNCCSYDERTNPTELYIIKFTMHPSIQIIKLCNNHLYQLKKRINAIDEAGV